MVTNAEPRPEPSTTREDVLERAAALQQDAVRQARTLLTGDANGRVRRNLLFVATAVLIIVAPLAALVPLMLLALTDMVVVDG